MNKTKTIIITSLFGLITILYTFVLLDLVNQGMETIKNSCGSRGCKVRIILPHDSGVKSFSSRVLQGTNDTKKVLSMVNLPLDKAWSKKAA